MAYPTCDCTMQSVGEAKFWCPRCGTLKLGDYESYPPKLVVRCREYQAITGCGGVGGGWHEIGIQESIYKPHERGDSGREQ